jgi:hypothetical protein
MIFFYLVVIAYYLEYNVRMAEMITANQNLSRHAQFVEQDNFLLMVSFAPSHLVYYNKNIINKEKALQMQAKIEELQKNLPKKIAKKMEENAQRARELELNIDGDDAKKTAKCIIC